MFGSACEFEKFLEEQLEELIRVAQRLEQI